MSSRNPVQRYQSVQVESASPEALVVIAYDALLKFLYQAKSYLAVRDVEKSHSVLKKGQILVMELISALNMDVWEGARNLMSLYEYILRRLQQANLEKDAKYVDEILPIVHQLRDTWQEAYKQLQAQKKSQISSRGAST